MSFRKAESQLFISLRFFASELFICWLCTALWKKSLGNWELLYFALIFSPTYSPLHALRLPIVARPWNQTGFLCSLYQTLLLLDLVLAVTPGIFVWRGFARKLERQPSYSLTKWMPCSRSLCCGGRGEELWGETGSSGIDCFPSFHQHVQV